MNLFAYSVRLKNFIKSNFNESTAIYRGVQSLYRKFFLPLERKAWKKNADGFESASALHMCSLLPKKTLDTAVSYYQPKSWLDVGCGTGSSLKYIKKFGINVTGLENSALAIKISKLGNLIKKRDLTAPVDLQSKFDVVWCYEVAEHLPESSADVFLDTLVSHGDHVILSAAIPGQGGEGHINEQPPSYWINKMSKRGFHVEKEITEKIHALHELYSDNVHCFTKSFPNNG